MMKPHGDSGNINDNDLETEEDRSKNAAAYSKVVLQNIEN